MEFADESGRVHRIERCETFRPGELPTVGQRVSVLYDPSDPDNPIRQFVSLGARDQVDPYLRKVLQ